MPLLKKGTRFTGIDRVAVPMTVKIENCGIIICGQVSPLNSYYRERDFAFSNRIIPSKL
jgi:hypothetical protein